MIWQRRWARKGQNNRTRNHYELQSFVLKRDIVPTLGSIMGVGVGRFVAREVAGSLRRTGSLAGRPERHQRGLRRGL